MIPHLSGSFLIFIFSTWSQPVPSTEFYNGMVQRAAADRIRGGGFAFPEPRRYVVAGFNALSECEKRLFGFLATAAETDFYWDYDSYYKDAQPRKLLP